MAKNITTLQHEALAGASRCGHTMSTWSLDIDWPHRYTSTCTHCGASVTVSSYPPHDCPEIIGDAVAFPCTTGDANA